MALLEPPREPGPRTLAWFGGLLAGFLGLAAALLWWHQGGPGPAVGVLAALAVVLPLAYYAVPSIRRPVVRAWTRLWWPVGVAFSLLLLATVWYVILTPVGVLRRLLGGDPLRRRLEPGSPTYWQTRGGHPSSERYFRPY